MKRAGAWSAVLLVAALAALLTECGGAGGERGTQGEESAYAALEDAPEKLGADNTTIVIGDPDAKVHVHLYEDPRCPYCKEFELSGGGPVLADWVVKRKASAHYTMASFLDDRLGGSGTKKAVNALRAALEAGKFAEYHAVLYRNQPEESTDGFTDARLLELASRVDGLRGKEFDSAVTTMKYRKFVEASQKAYEMAGTSDSGRPGPGTPTAEVNEMRVPLEYNGVLYDQTAFTEMLTNVLAMSNATS